MHHDGANLEVWIASRPAVQTAIELRAHVAITLGDSAGIVDIAEPRLPRRQGIQWRPAQPRLRHRCLHYGAVVWGLADFDDDPAAVRAGGAVVSADDGHRAMRRRRQRSSRRTHSPMREVMDSDCTAQIIAADREARANAARGRPCAISTSTFTGFSVASTAINAERTAFSAAASLRAASPGLGAGSVARDFVSGHLELVEATGAWIVSGEAAQTDYPLAGWLTGTHLTG